MENHSPLLNFGNYPEMTGNGLGDVQFIGRDIHIYVFGWRKIEDVWRRVVTGLAMMPQDALPTENLARLRLQFERPEEKRIAN